VQEIPFTPRLPPISHQAAFLSTSARRPFYALFWEQGTGKTKALIDNIALLACLLEIDAAFVLAPNGVHRNWHVEELPKHWPEDAPPLLSFCWDSTKAANKSFIYAWRDFLKAKAWDGTSGHVKIFCMSYDAMQTDGGKKASWDFLRHHTCIYIGDESQRFKTPAAKRTKTVIASGVYAKFRRIASGTPMDSPFDMYSQVRFLDPDHWARVALVGSFTAFKARFGQWIQQMTAGGTSYPQCVAYRDLEFMESCVSDISSRVMKEDVLDLPAKNYKRVFHELTNSQRAAYEELKAEAMTFLESGELVTAEMALILHLRLSQIGCGFIKPAPGQLEIPFTPNPRAQMLQTILEDLTRPSIIWGRFVHDTKTAYAASKAAGRRPVIFDGTRPELSVDAFHRGEYDDIIANLNSNMREGYTLNEADTTIYYSNSPKLLNRLQSEDRNHRIGQGFPVTIIDLLAERTLDAKTLTDLRQKRGHAGTVLGDDPDRVHTWLMEALS
jgi:hypothetical protein